MLKQRQHQNQRLKAVLIYGNMIINHKAHQDMKQHKLVASVVNHYMLELKAMYGIKLQVSVQSADILVHIHGKRELG